MPDVEGLRPGACHPPLTAVRLLQRISRFGPADSFPIGAALGSNAALGLRLMLAAPWGESAEGLNPHGACQSTDSDCV